jgi:hypothetical protein
LSSQATILSQVQYGVDYYINQESIIASTIAASFSTYSFTPLDATSIKSTIQIISFPAEARIYAAKLFDVLVLQTSSQTQIDPNGVFSSLTTQVDFVVFFLQH